MPVEVNSVSYMTRYMFGTASVAVYASTPQMNRMMLPQMARWLQICGNQGKHQQRGTRTHAAASSSSSTDVPSSVA